MLKISCAPSSASIKSLGPPGSGWKSGIAPFCFYFIMQEGKRQIFSLFFRIFRAKNRRNILVDDTTKRCYTLGNKNNTV